MSYCVNCGVELERSEPRCPLCGTEVVNPNQAQDDRRMRPYPRHIERINRRIDRRYTAALISLLLLIPLFTAMFCNLLASGGLTWSLYVLGGEAIVFACCLLPLLQNAVCRYGCILIDGVVVALFLLLINYLTKASWFLRFGLPITALATVYACFIAYLSEPRCRMPLLIRISLALAGVALLVVGVEFFLNLYRGVVALPNWSMYVLFPCLVLAASLLLLHRRARLKEEIRKRFYL